MNIESVHSLCTGCRACEQICPINCISIQEDYEGFLYPIVDNNRCTHCNKCLKTCHTLNKRENEEANDILTYAAINSNYEELMDSTSGGVFSALAHIAIRRNGVIFGCAFDEKFFPRHIMIDNLHDLDQLRGSKYVQSDTGQTYTKTRELLENGKTVFFSGNPCQIAGLKNFLGKDYLNLYTIDLVCLGVPSAKIFQSHISWLSKKLGEEIKYYRFRTKKFGWNDVFYCIKTDIRVIIQPAFRDVYFQEIFLNMKGFRESCYKCLYTGIKREGDFTIGDYWGVEKYHPNIPTKNGISLLLINTSKAKEIVNELGEFLTLYPSRIEYVVENNRFSKATIDRPIIRDSIYTEINKIGYEKWTKIYYRSVFYIRKVIFEHVPKKYKEKIYRFINNLFRNSG